MMQARRGGWRALLALATLLVLGGCKRPAPGAGAAPAAGKTEPGAASLLFPGPDGALHAETRRLALPLEADKRVEAVVAALLAGPKTAGLAAPLPKGVSLADAYVDKDGIAYLDLAAKDQATPPVSGSELELLRVYSLVDTVIANEPRVHAVVLLWNGMQRTTFAGHVDTTRPLVSDRRWVR